MSDNIVNFYKSEVIADADYRRIAAIPRRTWTEAETKDLVKKMTDICKIPSGKQTLRPRQAIALFEIAQDGRGFFPIPVGGGKTLISFLAPYVLEARRPLLLLPAGLMAKTVREMGEAHNHWKVSRSIRMKSYEELGRVKAKDSLDSLPPDLIILDEAHKVKNLKAAVSRRVARFMSSNPDTKVIVLSGTIMNHSITDFAHMMHWSMKHDSLVPFEQKTLMQWAEVLDDREMKRVAPGALVELATPEERKLGKFKAARLGFNRRLAETSGVLIAHAEGANCSIEINPVTYKVKPVTESHFVTLRSEWITPDEWELMQAVEVWACARQLALGFHYVWDPRPPKSWSEPRKDWNKFVRETLSRSHHLDSPHQVALACEAGELRRDYYDRWMRVKGSFEPNTVPQWHDESALDFCADWLEKHPTGICWVEHSYFGRALSKKTKIPYFGREGRNADGDLIDEPGKKYTGKRIIASAPSNGTGRNLQAWNENLIVSVPNGSALEQLIGRTHREGQQADEVLVDIVFSCAEHLEGWTSARESANMVEEMLGQPQKILFADLTKNPKTLAENGLRWTRTLSEKDAAFKLPTKRK